MKEESIVNFLLSYPIQVHDRAQKLRKILLDKFPEVTEQLDLPAKMVAYCYGQKYADLICMLIPSQKGLKLGFNRGVELPDPGNRLEGNGKISRYMVIRSEEDINSAELRDLLDAAVNLYRERNGIGER